MCCCCSLQTRVIVISSICLVFTVCATAILFFFHLFTLSSTSFPFHYNGPASAIGIGMLVWNVFALTSEVLSIVGSDKNNKRLLIPFIISLVLNLLGYIVYGITLIPHAPAISVLGYFIGFGFTTYFLVTVVQFYKELTARARLQPEMVLQQYEMAYTGPAGNRSATTPLV